MPRAVKHCIFEALGGQVGQQRAMADHLDVQSATLGAPSQPQENAEGGHFEQLFGCIKIKYTMALGPDEAEPRRKKRSQLQALLVPQECQERSKSVHLKALAAKWDISVP